MKQIKWNLTLLVVAGILVAGACGEAGKETEATTEPVATEVAAVPKSTIDTTPTTMVTIIHKVADFGKWMVVYEGDDAARTAAGLHNYVVARGLLDSNMVLVALRADDVAKAKAFTQNPALKGKMKSGGVIGAPDINFTLVTWQDTVNVGGIPRMMSMFTVKDVAVWRKAFDEGAAIRSENGIMVRNMGHDVDNPNNIRIVSALADTAKAMAWYASAESKKRIKDAGIIGDPKRFAFNIVKRY